MTRLLLFFAFAVGFAGVAAATESGNAGRDAALADIRAMVEGAEGDVALVVAITDRDRLLMTASHGYADIDRRVPAAPDTRFAIGSISKSFTAVALMQMSDEGRFDPDAPDYALVALASGECWRTNNGGEWWEPIARRIGAVRALGASETERPR